MTASKLQFPVDIQALKMYWVLYRSQIGMRVRLYYRTAGFHSGLWCSLKEVAAGVGGGGLVSLG